MCLKCIFIMGAQNNKNIYKKDKFVISVTHVRQNYSWDCGISCVMMVLNDESRKYFIDEFDGICEQEGFNKSTWTIDLSYILQRFKVKHCYYTTTLGIHPDYTSESFYTSVLGKDHERVNERFKAAQMHGLNVVQRSVNLVEILDHLSHGHTLIVLVNANLLACDTCRQLRSGLKSCLCCASTPPYQGHYVVLVGFHYSEGKFFYRNPGCSDKICSVSFLTFDKARKSFGTDEDILFIYS